MQRTGLVAALLLVLVGLTAHASDTSTIFGMELQKPFVMPECPFERIGKNLFDYFPPPKIGVCYQMMDDKNAGKSRPLNERVKLKWPDKGSPDLVSGYSAMAKIIDGNIEEVSFNTLGLVSQERDFNALKQKYGEPTESTKNAVQNAYGAQFLPIRASWVIGDITVTFDGAAGQTNSGLVRVATLKSIAETKVFLETLHQGKPPL